MALGESHCFKRPQILTSSINFSLSFRWSDCTIGGCDQRSKHIAFDRTHQNNTRQYLARADTQLHGTFHGSRFGPSCSIPSSYKCLALSLLGFIYVAQATDLASGNLKPWLGCSFHPFSDSSFLCHSGQSIFQKSFWPKESFISSQIENFKFGGNFRSEKYNIYIKNKCKVSMFSLFFVGGLRYEKEKGKCGKQWEFGKNRNKYKTFKDIIYHAFNKSFLHYLVIN